MTEPKNYTYVKQVLAENNFKIFRGGKQILMQDKIYTFSPLQSKYLAGSKFFKQGEIIRININELETLGYCVLKKTNYEGYSNIRVMYYLERASSISKKENKLPPGHELLLDLYNGTVSLKGGNTGFATEQTPWYPLPKVAPRRHAGISPLSEMKEKLNMYSQSNLPYTVKRKFEYVNINDEIPMFISFDGKIVCLPIDTDAPKIGFVGQSGEGNSLMLHRLIDHAYQKWNVKLGLINDFASENWAWAQPWDEKDRIPKVGQVHQNILYEQTTPLPIVPLYQTFRELLEDTIPFKDDISFKISISADKLFSNYNKFFSRIDTMELKNSEHVLRRLILDEDGYVNPYTPLMAANNMKDIDAFFKGIKVPIKKGTAYVYNGVELPGNSVTKIQRIMTSLFSMNILDSHTGIPSKWVVEFEDGKQQSLDPYIACMTANLVPIIVTQHIAEQKWFPPYYRELLMEIVDNQMNNAYFRRHNFQTWIVTDEINNILGQDPLVDEAYARTWRISRPNNIGVVYRAQDYVKILPTMKNNYGFYFATKMNQTNAKELIRDTQQDDNWIHIISSMAKRNFEVVGIPRKYFVTYDSEGVRREEERPFHGRMLPPISKHLKREQVL